MASAQQIIGLVKSHAEGDKDRFYDLAMQLAAAESQKGHSRLAEQLRQWAEAGASAPEQKRPNLTPLAAPRGELSGFLSASYPTARMADVIVPSIIEDELQHLVVEFITLKNSKSAACGHGAGYCLPAHRGPGRP